MKNYRHAALLLAVTVGLTAWVVSAGPLNPPAGSVASSYRTLDQLTPTWDRVLPAAERFQLVMSGEGVLDLETGLVWERNVNSGFTVAPGGAEYNKVVGGRRGWRLPSVEELLTLIDPSVAGTPKLPAGHPFIDAGPSGFQSFWTNTKPPFDASRLYQVDMSTGLPASTTPINQGQTWLVRGGSYSQSRP